MEMNERYTKIVNALNGCKNGCFYRISYKSDVPVKSEYKKQGVSIVKITDKIIRSGVNYSNMGIYTPDKSIDEKAQYNTRKNGYVWVSKNKVLYNENTDKHYVRIANAKSGADAHTKYIVLINGEVVNETKTTDSIKSYVIESYFKSTKFSPVQNISFDNIIRIADNSI